tara:strand:- start:1055 stop:2134 length:1080 start_codon:yes stop_codon:yes gene_type:complete
MITPEFWLGKKVFITGHTGFKGSWLSIWLEQLGCAVKGFALAPNTSPSLFYEVKLSDMIDSQIGDIRNQKLLYESMVSFNPDILIHMAAQPLVRYSYNNPIETFEVNVIGTAKVLEVARNCNDLKAIINVTSDKCYDNQSFDKAYKETDPVGGYDPYSASKGCAELIANSYRYSYLNDLNIGIASVRAGNVIGGGDWASDRLIPDILRSFEANKLVKVRNPNSIRPWQHVLEPLSGYLILAQKLYDSSKIYSGGWNFGPDKNDVKPVKWIVDKMISRWPGASWELENSKNPYEAEFLKLDISKANDKLNWKPTWELDQVIERIINWHNAWNNNEDMQLKCITEIKEFMKDMSNENFRDN